MSALRYRVELRGRINTRQAAIDALLAARPSPAIADQLRELEVEQDVDLDELARISRVWGAPLERSNR